MMSDGCALRNDTGSAPKIVCIICERGSAIPFPMEVSFFLKFIRAFQDEHSPCRVKRSIECGH